MNAYFMAAAALAFVVGLVHSVLGERLIFLRLRQGRLQPSRGGQLLGAGHVGILWASWHGLTILGWGFAAVLLWMGLHPAGADVAGFVVHAVVVSMLLTSALVLVGTRAKHPGWAALLCAAVLVWLGRTA